MPEDKLYYFDEYGFDLHAILEYGYSKIGERLKSPVSGKRSKRLNVLSARNHNHELVSPKIYDSTIKLLMPCLLV